MARNYVCLDVETTILNNGHPFTKQNKMCCVCISDKNGSTIYKIEYDEEPYGEALREIKERIEAADLLIGFSIKFDLHWLKRYVPDLHVPVIFDCQLAEFLILNQSTPYPSLDEACDRLSLGRKYDVVATEYWGKGIDTPDVPFDVLSEYCAHDVGLTLQLFHKQKLELVGKKRTLFRLQCEDLLGLLDAEINGLRYDFKQAESKGKALQVEISDIDKQLRSLAGVDWLNFGSSDQLSALLYGGIINERFREKTERVLKDGTIKQGERWSERPVEFPRLVKPLDGTESDSTAKLSDTELSNLNRIKGASGKRVLHRVYSTAAPVLERLRAKGTGRHIIQLLLTRAEKEKLDSTYYSGLVAKSKEMQWVDDEIHGQFNMVVAATGRLSSSNPNLQNMAGDIKDLFYSRYE